jgi:hypothetical protein
LLYRILGIHLKTHSILNAEQAQTPFPDIVFEPVSHELDDSSPHLPFHVTYSSDNVTPWLSWSKTDSGYILQFHGLAIFWFSADGRVIYGSPEPDVPESTITHLFLDYVLPYAISFQHKIVLHAGAVVIGKSAAVFVGQSGYGKSTLVTSFCSTGFPLLADDCLRLEVEDDCVWGFGSYPGLRLWDDSVDALLPATSAVEQVAHYTDKLKVASASNAIAFHHEPAPIRNIYMLEDPENTNGADTIHFEKLSFDESTIALLKHYFRLPLPDKAWQRREFVALTALAARIPVYRLSYPRDYNFLPSVRQAIIEHLQTI